MAFDDMDTEASMADFASGDASDAGSTGIDTDGARRTTASAVRPLSSSSGGGDAFQRSRRQPPKRRMSVYDAVAGRLHLAENSTPTAATTTLRDTALAPDEALFRSVHAPPRFEETDTYFAHADLDARGGVLPDSDLLVAVHQYASAFYEAGRFTERPGERRRRRKRRRQDGGKPASHTTKTHPERLLDERSLDETALLALGILLEEAGRAALGRDGDLVFTEGAEEEDTASWKTSSDEDDEAAAAAGEEGEDEEDSHEGQAADGADEVDATAG